LYLELLYKQLQRIDHLRIQTIHADDVRVGYWWIRVRRHTLLHRDDRGERRSQVHD
jgi:hypothetical protein